MKNLEYAAMKRCVITFTPLCSLAHISKYGDECTGKLCKSCDDCEFHNNVGLCVELLLAEHKETVKITKNEKAILESIDKKYKWITRDNNGELYVYINEPYRVSGKWEEDYDYRSFNLFKHLFKSIKCEADEPYNIQELLANCEVEER